MLFSDSKVSAYINEHFEPVWQSVRPVPKVTIDFGNGKVVTKTFRGNIATYVCTKEGFVFDILPGIYDRETYLRELKQIHDEEQSLASANESAHKFAAYHRGLCIAQPDVEMVDALDVALERASVDDSSKAKELLADSKTNESARRTLIHRKLMLIGLCTPAQMTGWLYSKVLHADLSDPYLGTKELLFANSER